MLGIPVMHAMLAVSPPVPTFGTHISVTHVDLPVKDKQGCHPAVSFLSLFYISLWNTPGKMSFFFLSFSLSYDMFIRIFTMSCCFTKVCKVCWLHQNRHLLSMLTCRNKMQLPFIIQSLIYKDQPPILCAILQFVILAMLMNYSSDYKWTKQTKANNCIDIN